MRLLVCTLVSLTFLHAASTRPVSPDAPFRFTATEDRLLHASLVRGYGEVPGNLEIVEVPGNAWEDETRSYTPENTQTHPGVRAFRTGLVRKGRTYEARVTAPGQLDLRFLEPPAANPRLAVEAGMSWLMRSADAWLSNQPRRGAIAKAGDVQHPEAQACIACHITQFTTRAYLTASANGYPAAESRALASVVGRLRDNPRPLYGHPGVNWTRVIYSARTVSSRIPALLGQYAELSGTKPDRDVVLGAARYLLLSDECGAGALRPEADGSRPDVSGFEIGLQTWQTFRLAASLEPANPKWADQSACMERIIADAKPENVIDASWRVIALKRIGKPTGKAVADLLTYQQPDGRFGAPAADFLSYHALYALAVAGHKGPAVDRLVQYTLRAQRSDGSWKGSPEHKGFDTPFRDTQFAVMALSELYPGNTRTPVDAPAVSSLPDPWRAPGGREALQASLLARMENEPLVNELAATLDENLAQLREWQRTIRMPSEQNRVEQGLRADSQRLATMLAKALASGSRTLRLRVLTAMATMAGTEGFVDKPRVGNDMEAPQILADADGALEQAILACFKAEDRELTTAAIRAGTALSDVLSPRFTLALLRLGPGYGPVVAEAFGEGRRGRLTLARNGPPDIELQAKVKEILETREPSGLAVVLPLLAELDSGTAFTREPYLAGAMENLLNDRPDEAVLKAASVFFHIVNGPLMRYQVMDALKASDPGRLRAAVDVVADRFIVNPNVAELTLQFLAASKGLARRMLIDSLDPARLKFRVDQISAYSPPRVPMPLDSNLLSVPFVQEFVVSSLRDSDPQVRAAALDLTRRQAKLGSVPAVKAEVAALKDRRAEPGVVAESLLDFDFFREKVHPILLKPGPDGRSCVMCHASNARFPIRTDAKANFASVAGKVTLANPAESPILVKPLLPGVTADGDVFRTSHNGGERWPARIGSSEYQTILEWIRGGKLAPGKSD